MTQLLQRFERKHMVWLVNVLVFSFFVTVLTFKKGYSYAPMTLAGIGIIYLFVHIFKLKKPLNFTKEDKWLIFAFLFYFGTFAFSAVYHGDGWREIDNPSRVLLFIPLLLLFREFPINIKVILHGIPIGATVTGVIAIYQKFYLGLAKPFPEIMSIQAGNISSSLSVLSLIVAIYWAIKRNRYFTILGIIASVFAIIASILSGSRGGWIGLPFIIIMILFLYRKMINTKLILVTLASFSIISITLVNIPKFGIMKRYEVAKTDIIRYIDKDDKRSSLGARFDMWNNAFEGIKEKFIFGWGSQGYIELKKEQIKNKQMEKANLRFNDAHNQYIDSFVKRGVVGFIGLILILLIPLRYFLMKIEFENLEIASISIIGIIHIISTIFYSLSQTFLAHNSGSVFYFILVMAIYSLVSSKSGNQ